MSDIEVMDIDAAEDANNEQNTPLRARELDYEGATTETDAQEGGFFSNVSETKKMIDTALVLDRGESGEQAPTTRSRGRNGYGARDRGQW